MAALADLADVVGEALRDHRDVPVVAERGECYGEWAMRIGSHRGRGFKYVESIATRGTVAVAHHAYAARNLLL